MISLDLDSCSNNEAYSSESNMSVKRSGYDPKRLSVIIEEISTRKIMNKNDTMKLYASEKANPSKNVVYGDKKDDTSPPVKINPKFDTCNEFNLDTIFNPPKRKKDLLTDDDTNELGNEDLKRLQTLGKSNSEKSQYYQNDPESLKLLDDKLHVSQTDCLIGPQLNHSGSIKSRGSVHLTKKVGPFGCIKKSCNNPGHDAHNGD